MEYKNINNHRWYYSLTKSKGLYHFFPKKECYKKLIVCLAQKNSRIKNKDDHLFSLFNHYLEFAKYMYNYEQKSFFEVILGECPQKPHFDVDIEKSKQEIDGEDVINHFIDALIKVFDEYKIPLNLKKNICIYTSNVDTETKQSYHIIINGYAHMNCVEAKNLYNMIIKHIPTKYVEYIDSSVYSSTQQFRIYASSKVGSNRVKRFLSKWKYYSDEITYEYDEEIFDEKHLFVVNLANSLITFTNECKSLPSFSPEINEMINDHITTREYQDVSYTVDREMAKLALNLLSKYAKTSLGDRNFPFKLGDVSHPYIALKRVKPSNCSMCNRIHKSENPFMVISGEDKRVYFFCRRNNEKKLYIGSLENQFSEKIMENTPTKPTEIFNEQNIKVELKNIAEFNYDPKKTSHLKKKSLIPIKNYL